MICAPVHGPSGEVFAVVLMVNKFCWMGGGSKAGPRSKGWGGIYNNVFDCLPSSKTMGNMVDMPSKQVSHHVGPGHLIKCQYPRESKFLLTCVRYQGPRHST